MTLGKILKSLVFIVAFLAFALVFYSSGTITSRCISPTSSPCPSETKSEGSELAKNGFPLGNA